jgi:hypothetical protein
VKVWDANTGPETRSFLGHAQQVRSIAWRFDGRQIASASMDGTVKIWDVALAKELSTLRHQEGHVYAAAWTADGMRLATAGADRTIRIWDPAHGVELNALHGHAGGVLAVAWSPDGRRLASAGDDRTIRIWDAATAKELHVCHGHDAPAFSIAWSPDGARLATASADLSIRIWNSITGAEALTLKDHGSNVNSIAWSPDGRWLASASADQTVCIWDASTGHAVRSLRGHTSRVNAVAWSPDGTRLASTGEDHTVKIWDPVTGKETLTLELGAVQGSAVAWGPDGLSLASAGTDRAILIHDATTGYLASLSPQCLPFLDRRLASDPNPSDWRLRAQVNACNGDWATAAADVDQYLAIVPEAHWLTVGCWIVGPYPESLEATYPPEHDPDPGHPVRTAEEFESSKLMNWNALPFNARGFVDFGPRMANAEHISAYALFRVYSIGKRDVAMLLGSDDQVRVWLNGNLVHESLRDRAAVPDEDAKAVSLQAGWNSILAKVVNTTGPHMLYLRLSDLPADLRRTQNGDRPTDKP